MRKATVTYRAPEGDNEVVHMGGVRFIDGEATEINSDDHPHLMSKIEGNQHFDVEMGEDVPDDKPKRGRPRGFKGSIEEARDHDFEADRRTNMGYQKETDGLPTPKGDKNPLGFTGTSSKPEKELAKQSAE